MTKQKLLNLLTVLSSLCVYLEWGNGQHTFLFSAEAEVFRKLFTEPSGVLHPLILLPLVGQLMLIISLFLKTPRRWLSLWGISLLGILPLFILVIGLMSLNCKIILSSLPFLACVIYMMYSYKKAKQKASPPSDHFRA